MYEGPEEFLKWATVHLAYITAPEEPMEKEARGYLLNVFKNGVVPFAKGKVRNFKGTKGQIAREFGQWQEGAARAKAQTYMLDPHIVSLAERKGMTPAQLYQISLKRSISGTKATDAATRHAVNAMKRNVPWADLSAGSRESAFGRWGMPAMIGTNIATSALSGGIGHHVGYNSGEETGYGYGLNDGAIQANQLRQNDMNNTDFMSRLMYLFSGNGDRIQNSMAGMNQQYSPVATKYLGR